MSLSRASAVHPAEHNPTNLEAEAMSTELKVVDRMRVTTLRPDLGYQVGKRSSTCIERGDLHRRAVYFAMCVWLIARFVFTTMAVRDSDTSDLAENE
jgi:hypothetical protein